MLAISQVRNSGTEKYKKGASKMYPRAIYQYATYHTILYKTESKMAFEIVERDKKVVKTPSSIAYDSH